MFGIIFGFLNFMAAGFDEVVGFFGLPAVLGKADIPGLLNTAASMFLVFGGFVVAISVPSMFDVNLNNRNTFLRLLHV